MTTKRVHHVLAGLVGTVAITILADAGPAGSSARAAESLAAKQAPAPTCQEILSAIRRLDWPPGRGVDVSGDVTGVSCAPLGNPDRQPAQSAQSTQSTMDYEITLDPDPFPKTLCPECTASSSQGALYGWASLWQEAAIELGLAAAPDASSGDQPAFWILGQEPADLTIAFVQTIGGQLQLTQSIALRPQHLDALQGGGDHFLYVPVYVHPTAEAGSLLWNVGASHGGTDPIALE